MTENPEIAAAAHDLVDHYTSLFANDLPAEQLERFAAGPTGFVIGFVLAAVCKQLAENGHTAADIRADLLPRSTDAKG
jgi:hypothetical protein